MARKTPLLERMRQNPRGDWTISDIEKLCSEYEIELEPPSNGSHFKAISPHLSGQLTIPAKRPVKPVYIRLLVQMIDDHQIAVQQIRTGGKDD